MLNQEHCISEQNWEANQRTEVVHIYTCQGRNNLNTLMYFNSLTLYNHILFSNNYGYILLKFEWRFTADQIIVVQIFLVMAENTAV